MNYTELTAAIKAYVENDFPATTGIGDMTSAQQIAIFVRQAEQRIYNSVQFLVERNKTTSSCTANSPYLSYPTGWLSGYSLAVISPSTGQYTYLLNKDPEFIREAYPSPTATGTPQYYAYDNESRYILGPTPDAAYTAEIVYFKYPTSIVDASTSWLGTNADAALLYGSLLEAYTFMKGEQDVMAKYQERYDAAIEQLRELGEGKNRQDMYRTEQARYPVK